MKIIRSKKDIVLFDELDSKNEICGTHHQGEMLISYSKLVEKLGRPTSKGDNYKVSAEWEIITPFGMGTIYDYKQSKKYCGKEGDLTKDITSWNVGGHNKETCDCIISLFFK